MTRRAIQATIAPRACRHTGRKKGHDPAAKAAQQLRSAWPHSPGPEASQSWRPPSTPFRERTAIEVGEVAVPGRTLHIGGICRIVRLARISGLISQFGTDEEVQPNFSDSRRGPRCKGLGRYLRWCRAKSWKVPYMLPSNLLEECSRQRSDWHRHICPPSNTSMFSPPIR